jgi:ABC-type lipopolysaccharide export system ATPase subunit
VSIGPSTDPIPIDYALEAKCYALDNPVGVKDVSRLISRLRHRQFGVLVTTSYLGEQAYEEIREDRHPVVVLASGDIVDILKIHELGTPDATRAWLSREFPAA